METHAILGGKVQLFRRPNSDHWQARTSVGGKQHQKSMKEESLFHAKDIAEDWYLELRGKSRAGLLTTEESFGQAAKKFETSYDVLTEGQRSEKWTEGHKIRLRVHLVPYFGTMGVSKIARKAERVRLQLRAESSAPS